MEPIPIPAVQNERRVMCGDELDLAPSLSLSLFLSPSLPLMCIGVRDLCKADQRIRCR